MSDGWRESARAWIADMGERGDYGREFVLDPDMIPRITGRGFSQALDVGCGEGRFCRILRQAGVKATGLDPTPALLAEARRRDAAGSYVQGRAEALPFKDSAFDLVVSCLSLVDIPDFAQAISEMARVLRPSGTLLIANLNSFMSSTGQGWIKDANGARSHVPVDQYLQERAYWAAWRDIRILNWHRPLSAYMEALLRTGLVLRVYAEPPARGGPAQAAEYQRRAPWYVVMEWVKPA